MGEKSKCAPSIPREEGCFPFGQQPFPLHTFIYFRWIHFWRGVKLIIEPPRPSHEGLWHFVIFPGDTLDHELLLLPPRLVPREHVLEQTQSPFELEQFADLSAPRGVEPVLRVGEYRRYSV